jgi:hypothetical protein
MKTDTQTFTCNDCAEPVRESDNHPCDEWRMKKYGLAPNTAQQPAAHSPHSIYGRMEALEQELVQAAIDDEKLTLERDKARLHADKLAELCQRLTDLLEKHSITPHENGKPRHDLCTEGKYLLVVQDAKSALAAYEEEGQ